MFRHSGLRDVAHWKSVCLLRRYKNLGSSLCTKNNNDNFKIHSDFLVIFRTECRVSHMPCKFSAMEQHLVLVFHVFILRQGLPNLSRLAWNLHSSSYLPHCPITPEARMIGTYDKNLLRRKKYEQKFSNSFSKEREQKPDKKNGEIPTSQGFSVSPHLPVAGTGNTVLWPLSWKTFP